MKLVREKRCTNTGTQKRQVRGDPAWLLGAASPCMEPQQLHPGVFKPRIKEAIFHHKKCLHPAPFSKAVGASIWEFHSRLGLFNSSDERKKHIWRRNQAARKELRSLPLVVKKPSAVEHTAPHLHLPTSPVSTAGGSQNCWEWEAADRKKFQAKRRQGKQIFKKQNTHNFHKFRMS